MKQGAFTDAVEANNLDISRGLISNTSRCFRISNLSNQKYLVSFRHKYHLKNKT